MKFGDEMDELLMTQIIGVSFIFVIVSFIALFNFIKINHYYNKIEKEKSKEEKRIIKRKDTNIYEVKTRKKS